MAELLRVEKELTKAMEKLDNGVLRYVFPLFATTMHSYGVILDSVQIPETVEVIWQICATVASIVSRFKFPHTWKYNSISL